MLDFSKYCEILIFDVAKQNNNTETSLNETVNVEFIKNSEKYFYKLWLEDVELYKEHSKIKQLSANWEMWLYDVTQTYFNKFAINCNNNNSLAVTELELLRERLFSSFEKFEKDMHGKYSYNTFYKEPKYLLDQASYFYGISESESYRLRSLLTKQSLFYSNFKINRNLPFMTYSEEDPMDKAMVSTKTSIDLDKQLEWSAYQYRVVIRLLKEVPKIWHEDHQEKAFEVKMDTYQDLVSALHSLQIFINQTDMTCLNLAQSSLIDFKSELAAQLAFKRNFLVKKEQNKFD